jgi:hypothetical protein
MSETKPEAKDETLAATPAPEATPAVELTDKQLDQAAGGLWPYVLTGSTYNKTI